MKLIIDIDEETYIKANAGILGSFGEIITNGTPLPKGHGDLIDRDKAYAVLDNAGLSLNCSGLLVFVPTVIPADKEKNNETDN